MKGQVSYEFISLLAITLFSSAILSAVMTERAAQFGQNTPYTEARKVAQKVAYRTDYAISNGDTETEISFSPKLQEVYNVSLGSGYVTVNYSEGKAVFPTKYSGPDFEFSTSENLVIGYSDSLYVK